MTDMETALRLYKAHSQKGNLVEGMPVWDKVKNTLRIYDFIDVYENLGAQCIEAVAPYQIVKPETLSIYTGLNAEWAKTGIDKRIWSGDLLDTETILGNFKKWQVVYKNAAFWAERMDNGETHLLSGFLSNYAYTKIGSIHDEK